MTEKSYLFMRAVDKEYLLGTLFLEKFEFY